ncbi:54S ribosomal protein L4 mitochondrial [Vanrija albida]|uniref:Large ribosomal subunit protein uL29m n=1 Tax=Vanrija albida TaxID=181172 RepID=A0ABR3QDI1_9TREE
MSAPRLARSLATSALRPAPEASASAPRFTPKGRPIPTRPPRSTRVSLPSGFPEPPSYPPPASYFAELKDIESRLPANQATPKPHPLWAFFHVPPAALRKVAPKAQFPPDMGSLDRLDDEAASLASGRSWTAAELRLKSFEDLHTLWYVLLRERNVLATQREERRRAAIPPGYGGEVLTKRGFRCRKSMARIKYVLNERRLALIAAGGPLLPPAEPHFDVLSASAAIADTVTGVDMDTLQRQVAKKARKPKKAQKAQKTQPTAAQEAEIAAEIAADAAAEDAEIAAEQAAEKASEQAAESKAADAATTPKKD